MHPFRQLPLEDLLLQYAAEERDGYDGAAAYELFRRALGDGNDAAWDALALRCRRRLLIWVYELRPETPPRTAETLADAALMRFRAQTGQPPAEIDGLLRALRACLQQILG